MKDRDNSLLGSLEGWIVVVVPMLTILFGAAMIHVAVRFGFTAVGEPVATVEQAQR